MSLAPSLDSSPLVSDQPRPLRSSLPVAIFAIAFGCLLSLTLTGYQIGESNHTVYLLDGIRHADPELLTRDWFVNGTLQYHGLFSYFTRWCIGFGEPATGLKGDILDAGILRPAFLIGYLLTVIGFHYWIYQLVRVGLTGSAGGEEKTPLGVAVVYLMTVVLYELSAGGTGLGGFQFLQDSAFLPSNVSNVAMLAGIVLLMERRIWAAAVALGLAGIFHINHAVFAPFVFAAGAIAIPGFKREWRWRVLAGFGVGVMCLVNVGPSMLHLANEGGAPPLSLAEFVQIYARLRHPHHYYPRAWHPMVYVGALWTFVPTAYFLLKGAWRLPETPRRVGLAVAVFLNAAALFALIFAGVVYVSERLVQMAVFRFTIYPELLSCAVCAWGLFDSRLTKPRWANIGVWVVAGGLVVGVAIAWSGVAGELAETFVRKRPVPFAFAAVLIALVAVLAQFRRREMPGGLALALGAVAVVIVPIGLKYNFMGLNFLRVDPPAYKALATWCRDHTPKDALFIVPPNDQAFRIASQRSIFINFKAIPQTAKELPEWKRRMQLLTGVQDLPSMASTWNDALKRFGDVYAARPESELVKLAHDENARYIVTTANYPDLTEVGPGDTQPFHLYDVGPSQSSSQSSSLSPSTTLP